MARDNFTKKTITLLGERVGFICSNPACKTHTIGSNSIVSKSTKIGKAAHITAASIGGPRYDQTLTSAQRSDINNGIWLCSNCSDLIDKDEAKYSKYVLLAWKELAELESAQRIKAESKTEQLSNLNPYLEADLSLTGSLRSPTDYSDKNPGQVENGIYIIDISNKPIIHWVLTWKFDLIIYNNSSYPAFNVSINPLSDIPIITKSTLPKVNNLQAFDKKTLKITYQEKLEDRHMEADRRLAMRIPEGLNGMSFEINYFDESRREHQTVVKIEGQQIINDKNN